MIHRTIIVTLTIGAVGVGALWGASYWTPLRWECGDRLLEDRRLWITVAISQGEYVLRAERRDEWRRTPLTSRCGFRRDDAAPKDILLPGVRFEIVKAIRVRRPESPDESVRWNAGDSSLRLDTSRAMRDDEPTVTLPAVETSRVWHRFSSFPLLETTAPSGTLILWVSPWIPVILLGVYPCFAFTRRRLRRHLREKGGLCLTCGYNLTGNESGVCPECGTKVDSI